MSKTNANGLFVRKGKYGGTYAHKDIAFEFASAISSVFKLYLIKKNKTKEAIFDILSKIVTYQLKVLNSVNTLNNQAVVDKKIQ